VTGYEEEDRERWVSEPAKRPARSAFERDRARVLHCAALRRLAAKTQVVLPYENDFPRTRLTHSMEVGQIGRELGQALGCDPDLVETACLAHDLGHPPFGHNGEIALAEVAEACGGFEGNAQSVRILTRLEAKAFAPDGRSVGLNLTRGALDAATKYPWQRREDTTKFGVYLEDLAVFEWMRKPGHGERRCFEAQVMDWSDDVAYSVHDLEDALHAGHLSVEALRSGPERAHLVELARERYADGDDEAAVAEALDRLLAQPWWPATFDGSQQSLAALKNLTSQLIGRFCTAAEDATRETYGPGQLTRYAADLVVPDATRLECAVLKAVTAVYVMGRSGAPEAYARQRELVRELSALVLLGAPGTLDAVFAPAWEAASDDGGRLRVVVDQVASLTDPSAMAWHRRLTS
jgi:dGTPase